MRLRIFVGLSDNPSQPCILEEVVQIAAIPNRNPEACSIKELQDRI